MDIKNEKKKIDSCCLYFILKNEILCLVNGQIYSLKKEGKLQFFKGKNTRNLCNFNSKKLDKSSIILTPNTVPLTLIKFQISLQLLLQAPRVTMWIR